MLVKMAEKLEDIAAKVIKKQDANKVEFGPMKINEYKINPNFSGALIELDGRHGKVKCLKEDRLYFVVEGAGQFMINDSEYNVANGDVVFVPKNTSYDIEGKMKYFLVCSPEFNPDDDIKLD